MNKKTISNLSQKIIYRFLTNNFIKEIKDELDLYVVFNLRSYLFEDLNSMIGSQLARKNIELPMSCRTI